MKNFRNFTALLVLATLASCQTPMKREPSSFTMAKQSKEWEELRELRQRSIELGALSVHFQKKKNEAQLEKIREEQGLIAAKIKVLEFKVSALDSGTNESILTPEKPWRTEKERWELGDISLYEQGKNVQFSVSTYDARETVVRLSHSFFSKETGVGIANQNDHKHKINFTAKCDAPFSVKFGVSVKKVKANKEYKFSIEDKVLARDYRDIIFRPDMKNCEFNFVSTKNLNKKYSFKVVNEAQAFKKLESLLSTTEVCSVKSGTGKFFDTTEFPTMICPKKYESIQFLPEPEDSFHARAVALLGQDLPEDFIKNGDPYAELDFSKAPKFDAIAISYLVYRADFYGTLLSRILAHHADKGAIVRIIVSEVISLDKDEALYEKLMAKHPNIKVIKYKFDKEQKGGSWFAELHRTNHVKIFAAYSKSNPEDSFAIVGGKNIHDGFVFKTPVDVAKYPEVVNYVSGDESWAYWRDFEMVIKGQEFVESVVRNYLNFYHVDKENLVMKLSSVAVEKELAAEAEQQSLRYYVSIPFKDEPNLNLYYARLIDTAKKKVLISSPYFRPVKEIAEAMERAVKRGVKIKVITRLDLEGDTADFILGAVNKDGVNQFYKEVEVYEYTEPKVILHSKLVMIDDEVSFISSVNLNKRSFYHDLENGVLVNDKKFTVEMGELYNDYLKISTQLTEHQKIVFWKKWIIKIFDKVL